MDDRNKTAPLLFLAALLTTLLFADIAGLFVGIDHFFYDLSFRVRGRRPPPETVIIAAIDEKTLQKWGRWPVRRGHYASLLEKMNEATVVGIDLLLAEPSEEDPLLATTIREQGRVILPLYLDPHLGHIPPLPSFSPRGVGHAHTDLDIDGTARRVFHTLYYQGRMFPSFSSAVYDAFADQPLRREINGTVGTVPSPGEPDSAGVISQRDPMNINYYGPGGTFRSLSASDIEEGIVPPSFFKGKAVLVGLTALGLEDKVLTPFSAQRKRTSGVEVEATLLANLLDETSLKEVAAPIAIPLLIFLSVSSFFIFTRISRRNAILFATIGLAAGSALLYLLFSTFDLWIRPTRFYLSIVSVYSLASLLSLDTAARRLEQTHLAVESLLRWKKGKSDPPSDVTGVVGFLSKDRIESKIDILTRTIDNLLFEKKLVDASLFSDLHGVMLFGPNNLLVMSNRRAQDFIHPMKGEIREMKELLETLLPCVMEKDLVGKTTLDDLIKKLEKEGEQITCTLFTQIPKRTFMKLDLSPLFLDDQRYLLCLLTDVTRLKEMEIQKGEMASIVSHELKQPLTAILGYSDLMLTAQKDPIKRGLPEDLSRDLLIVREEALRMKRFITRFLDISTLESGQYKVFPAQHGIEAVVHEAVQIVKQTAETKKIKLTMEKPPRPFLLSLDRDLTVQCLINLIENAVKYSPPDTEVVIRLILEEALLKIEIIDQGYGIEPEELDRVFDRFYRGKETKGGKAAGSGLGLAFVKKGIEAQGGTVLVRSKPGHGSIFSIAFPIC